MVEGRLVSYGIDSYWKWLCALTEETEAKGERVLFTARLPEVKFY